MFGKGGGTWGDLALYGGFDNPLETMINVIVIVFTY